LEELLIEDPLVAKNRENCRKVINSLRRAQEVINEVSQFKV